MQKFASGGKEDGFVLDSTNKKISTMKDEISLDSNNIKISQNTKNVSHILLSIYYLYFY